MFLCHSFLLCHFWRSRWIFSSYPNQATPQSTRAIIVGERMEATCPHPFLILSFIYSLTLAQRLPDASHPFRSTSLNSASMDRFNFQLRGRDTHTFLQCAFPAPAPICGCQIQQPLPPCAAKADLGCQLSLKAAEWRVLHCLMMQENSPLHISHSTQHASYSLVSNYLRGGYQFLHPVTSYLPIYNTFMY